MSDIKSRKSGSEIFDTAIITTGEAALFFKVMAEEGIPKEEMLAELECIDDLLRIQRMQSIAKSQSRTATGRIRKNSTLLDLYSNRIGKHVEEINEIRNLQRQASSHGRRL